MSKALVSMYAGDAGAVMPVTWPPMLRYAERCGYQPRRAQPHGEGGLAASWSKVCALLGALEDCELALWLDADTLVLEHAWDVASELPAECFQAMAYDARFGPCTPIWVVRADGGRAFLEELWARRREAPTNEDYLIQQLLGCERETSLGTLRLAPCWGDHEGCCERPLMVHRGFDSGADSWHQRALVLAHEAQRGPRTPGGV
jgi:hypothetical protein